MSEMIKRVTEAAIDAFYAQTERTDAEATAFYYIAPRRTEIVVRGTFDVEAIARAAIAAMREPTLAMLEAATAIDPSRDDYPHASADAHWPVMIDAVLAEEKQPA